MTEPPPPPRLAPGPSGSGPDPELSPVSPLIGRQLGDFRIIRLLGIGGMGEVYLAEQVSLRRHVALKVLLPELVNDRQYIERFRNEALAVAAISHPNIVSVITIGVEGNLNYIALEYVPGKNLRDYIRRKGALEVGATVKVLLAVTAALHAAHEAGIVHRDIKPENVLLTRKGDVKVADFGLARNLTTQDVRLTASGLTMGTPLYMSPEQIEGQEMDHRTDLYSLGIMAYHMLAGEPPFRGSTPMAVALAHLRATPRPLREIRPDVPPLLEEMISRLMAKHPNNRYASATDVLAVLGRVRNDLLSRTLVAPSGGVDLDGGASEGDFLASASGQAVRSPSTPTALPVTRSFEHLAAWTTRPRIFPWVVTASLLLALGLGLSMGTRATARQLALKLPVETNLAVTDKTAAENLPAIIQNLNTLLDIGQKHPEAEQRRSAFWAVLLHFRGEEAETIYAGLDLVRDYFQRRDYAAADVVAEALSQRDAYTQQIMGQLIAGLTDWRRGDLAAARAHLQAAQDLRGRLDRRNGDGLFLPRDTRLWFEFQLRQARTALEAAGIDFPWTEAGVPLFLSATIPDRDRVVNRDRPAANR